MIGVNLRLSIVCDLLAIIANIYIKQCLFMCIVNGGY